MDTVNKIAILSGKYPEIRKSIFNVLNGYAVLDIGFGHVNNLVRLRKHFDVVFGIDNLPRDNRGIVLNKYEIKLTTLEKLKKQNIFVIIDDYDRVLKDFKANSFDGIVMSFSWFGTKQRKRLAKELYRIATKGGILYLRHPLTNGEVQLLRDAGWVLVQHWDTEFIFRK